MSDIISPVRKEEYCHRHPSVRLNFLGVCFECVKTREKKQKDQEEIKKIRKELWDSIIWPKQ
jgi:hypothetical protein